MQVLASLEDGWLLLKVLLDDSNLQRFKFLLSWDRMNEKEKMRLYNKYNCSEVNVFIYFRDRPFFDAYLAPYLQSKIEKSFLDVWLTGGDVSRFLQPQFFDRLNAFERALLGSRVSEEEGAAIELGMKNNAAHNPLSRFAFASIFQSAMNLKSLNVLPPEEMVIESHSPHAGKRLYGAKPNLCGARRPMIWLMSDNSSYQPRMMGFGVWTLSGCLMHWILVLCQYLLLQWLLCHLIDSLLSGLIEWMTLTLPKGRVWNITTSDSRKRRRFRRDSITKALKCFLLSVLFPIQLSGLPLPIICAAARLLLSSPKTSFSALTLFQK